jgi:protein-S-isoprenylcysteine O-methyltransferase Ste14
MKNKISPRMEIKGIISLFIFLSFMSSIFFILPELSEKYFPVLAFEPPYKLLFTARIILVLGLLLWVDSVVLLRIKGKGSPHPKFNPTNKIVKIGPYKYLKHPIYLAFFMIFSSISIIKGNYLLLLLVFLYGVLVNFVIIPKEEINCSKKFGEEYEDYYKNTGRLLPKISNNKFFNSNAGLIVISLVFFLIISVFGYFSNNYSIILDVQNEIILMTTKIFGGILCLSGLTFLTSAIVLFITKKKGLKTYGPYKFVRNPMYSGLFQIYLGIATITLNLTTFLFFPLIFSIAYLYVAKMKEEKQIKKYGAEFTKYKIEVSRFFPFI